MTTNGSVEEERNIDQNDTNLSDDTDRELLVFDINLSDDSDRQPSVKPEIPESAENLPVIRCTVCASILGGQNNHVNSSSTNSDGNVAAEHQDRDETDNDQPRGITDEKEELSSGNLDGARRIDLDENDCEAQDQQDENKSFIALACTSRCAKTNDGINRETTKESTNVGYYYYCVPDCWEHFLQFHWGIYSGLGQAHERFSRGPLGYACGRCRSDLKVVDKNIHGSLSMEQSLALVSPQILSKAFTIFQSVSTVEETFDKHAFDEDINSSNLEEKETRNTIRRITQELEDLRLLKCPSCHYKIAIPEDRGCDAAWCEHCGRAFCLYCLTDCGDHPKTDPTANHSNLVGDAHDHVANNDCGLTAGKGVIHSGKTLSRYHERQFLKRAALRLKRVPDNIREQVCRNLVIPSESLNEMVSANAEEEKRHSLTELRREMENDKWEQYSEQMRVDFLHAAYKGDVIMVRTFLEAGTPCSIPDAVGGETALHFAASKGQASVVKALLEYGTNPWQLSPPGRTALDDLCNIKSSCDLETARLLVRACMLAAPAIYPAQKVVYPWLRQWPNGTTAQSSAKKHHPDSHVCAYFISMQANSFKLSKACATGETEQVRDLLSNTSSTFPRPNEETPYMKQMPPAEDLVWIYNQGSGCTPLLDLCAKSLKLCPQHVLTTTRMILDAASRLDRQNPSETSLQRLTSVQRLLRMRDCKFNATALHWLALDPRPEILKVAGLLLRHAGNALTQSVDRRGQTPLDWARRYALPKDEIDTAEDNSEERQRHIQRWEVMILAWEEDP